MSAFFKRPFAYAGLFAGLLTALTAYVLLDAFVIPHEMASAAASETQTVPTADAEPVITENSYEDANCSIQIETLRIDDTTVYVADVRLAAASLLKTALAQNTYGLNVRETTSAIASAQDAIFAVNGDYYGARKNGYVIKNGTLYRSTTRSDPAYEYLVIYEDGRFGVINELEISAQQLIDDGVCQLLCFGPTLVQNGSVVVAEDEEVSRAKTSNPRTAIGTIDTLHYVFVVADGRSEESAGLSLLAPAEIMQARGCTTAYNLDGGGSSTMYFNGRVVNEPTTGGSLISEREVSDIVCIGY